MRRSLTLRAGPDALALLRERGLRAEDVDIVPGASGGAKWLVLAGLDEFLFGEFLQQPRVRPLHLIGSSIGSWRMACLSQHDPVAALARGHHAYTYEQRYSKRPSAREVSAVLSRALDYMLGETGVDEIMSHPWARLHVITAATAGPSTPDPDWRLRMRLAAVVAGNLFSRRLVGRQMQRVIFDAADDASPFRALADLPTTRLPLTRGNLRSVLLASGSIPLLMEGVRVPGDADRVHWDGGVLDYHIDVDFGPGDGLVLYPHFFAYVVPGWFDKPLPWRRASGANFRRALLIAPSDDFVASLPGRKIPDRRDFFELTNADRIARWQAVRDASLRLGDELRELILTGRLIDHVQPW